MVDARGDDRRAPFIVFEGGEGGGKSTQAALLTERIAAATGTMPVLTRQPGGTTIGAALREILLDPANAHLADRAEALLMAADRAQHAAELIRPNIEAGVPVISDRYLYSSVAYQGYGRQQDPARIRDLSVWATEGLWPDLVVVLDVDAEVAASRLQRELDRFEQAGADFHERVRQGFLMQAAEDPERFVVIDAAQSIEDVAAAIWEATKPVLERYP